VTSCFFTTHRSTAGILQKTPSLFILDIASVVWGAGLPFCTECGGKLRFDRKLKQYACESCGMTYTDAEILEARDRSRGYSEEEERKKRSQEYLDWWFKSKKKSQ